MPYRAVCPHRDLTRTARFVADASGLAALDLIHAPQSSPAVFAALRGIGAVSLGPTPASVAILRSIACASPPVAIARAQKNRKIGISVQFLKNGAGDGGLDVCYRCNFGDEKAVVVEFQRLPL